MNMLKRGLSALLMLVILVSAFTGVTAFAEDAASSRWADASVRAKLHRMEYNGMVVVGEESVVRLTDFGREIAVRLYEQHAPDRERMISEGAAPEEAERGVLLQ